MIPSAVTPGLRVTVERRGADRSALRSDVAGFVGPTRRGPVWADDGRRIVATRVEGWREYLQTFGGETGKAMPSAVRGYFQNGGEIAYVARIEASTSCAHVDWRVSTHTDPGLLNNGFTASVYEIRAANPGKWAERTRVSITYRRDRLVKAKGTTHRPELDIVVEVPGEPPERLLRLQPDDLVEQVAAQSRFVRFIPKAGPVAKARGHGPRAADWELVLLGGTDDPFPTEDLYRTAIGALTDEPEVALLVAPDLLGAWKVAQEADDDVASRLLGFMMQRAEEEHDRLVVADLPDWVSLDADPEDWRSTRAWRDRLANEAGPTALRSAAVYHPPIQVRNPLGGTAKPLRDLPSSGHVAGVISWLDRVRGAHHTPANAIVYGALDVAETVSEDAETSLREAGVNPIRCAPGRGLVIWGGRTLLPRTESRSGIFVAHRRLVHRLVRAIRLAASPLVFDVNGPELWLVFVRAVTSVLLDAFRAGALKGTRPEEAFRVRCDERTNPPTAIDDGQCVCEIEIAPAAPMEFILIRLALTTDGSLNLVEA